MIPRRMRSVLVSGVFILFALVSSHLCGSIHLSSLQLLTFRLCLWLDIQFVDDEVISFCFLVFLLTVWPLCLRTAEVHSRPCLPGDHLQQLQNSKDCYQFLLLLSLSQKDTRQMSICALLYEVTLLIYRGQGAA